MAVAIGACEENDRERNKRREATKISPRTVLWGFVDCVNMASDANSKKRMKVKEYTQTQHEETIRHMKYFVCTGIKEGKNKIKRIKKQVTENVKFKRQKVDDGESKDLLCHHKAMARQSKDALLCPPDEWNLAADLMFDHDGNDGIRTPSHPVFS